MEYDEFITSVNEFLLSIQKFKNDNADNMKKVWKKEYENIEGEIKNILQIAEFNFIDAKQQYDKLEYPKYTTFTNYVYNTNSSIKNIKGTIERTKTLRAKRKNNKCLKCGYIMTYVETALICEHCGYEDVRKNSSPNTRTPVNTAKHINKQLESLCGQKKLPSHVLKLKDYIAIWLTDLHFINEWLTRNGNKQTFIEKYYKTTSEVINDEFFDRVLDRIPEMHWEFKIFKLFMDEFYFLMEKTNRAMAEKTSNLNNLTEEVILDIFYQYLEKNSKIPNINTKFMYNNVLYEIGLYINELSLIYSYSEEHIKYKIFKLFEEAYGEKKNNFTIPGLMFNFAEEFKLSESIPRRYTYTAEYPTLNNYVFNVPFVEISPSDIGLLEEIIVKFNQYYKKHNDTKDPDKKNNSPLFCCTIVCIITQLTYFNKYINILNYIPDKYKESMTSNLISKQWLNFIIDNPDITKKYRNNNINAMVEVKPMQIPIIIKNNEEYINYNIL